MIGDRWGVTDDEVARAYPCDAHVTNPALEAWRGVTVHAGPATTWRWVRQVRLGPYSYDWVDNLGRRSPATLQDLPDPAVGDPFTATGGRSVGRVLAVEPGVHLTGVILGTVLTYLLVPGTGTEAGTTRLLLKLAMPGGSLVGRAAAPLLSVGDLVMARKQLLTFKRLAEQPG